MDVVIAVVLFIVGAVVAGLNRAWAMCCVAAGLAVLSLDAALNQF
jgi:hypothetical protein